MSWKNTLQTGWIKLKRLGKQISLAVFLAGAVAPLTASRATSILEKVRASGQLVVISRNGPTTYYENAAGLTGFEYFLTSAFAQYLDVELVIKDTEELGQIWDQLGSDAHLAALGLTITEKRQNDVSFSTPYSQVTQELIFNTGSARPKTVEDLIGKRIVVISNSSHAEHLRKLQKEFPELTWEERADVEMLDLMEMVHNKKTDYAILDSNAYNLNKSLYPKAKIAFSISDTQDLAWAFPLSDDKSLLHAANAFLSEFTASGALRELELSVYGHLGEMNYSDSLVFTKRMNTRLPKWKSLLTKAAEENGIPWKVLAALSYQESHWNPKAKSRTGVRGFMMLTRSTAKEVEVSNRLDPRQSISGGARYFRKMLNRLPENITGQDRLWLAMAAYNVGFGHVQDARIMAQQHGLNPNTWNGIKEVLPLLTKRQYYKDTLHGYARGQEAVDYVQNIRNFHAVLAWNEVEQERLAQNLSSKKQKSSKFNSLISQIVANDAFFETTPL